METPTSSNKEAGNNSITDQISRRFPVVIFFIEIDLLISQDPQAQLLPVHCRIVPSVVCGGISVVTEFMVRPFIAA
jgi:hypothetical protein